MKVYIVYSYGAVVKVFSTREKAQDWIHSEIVGASFWGDISNSLVIGEQDVE